MQMLLPGWMAVCTVWLFVARGWRFWKGTLSRVQYLTGSKVDRTVEPKEGGLMSSASWPLESSLPSVEWRDGWNGASCHEPSLPGQTGYQQVAFWDGAGRAQTVWCARLGAPSPTPTRLPHLPSLTHLLTVWTASFHRQHCIFFFLSQS